MRLVCTVCTKPIGLRMCVQCVPGLGLGTRLVCTVCTRLKPGYEPSVYSGHQAYRSAYACVYSVYQA